LTPQKFELLRQSNGRSITVTTARTARGSMARSGTWTDMSPSLGDLPRGTNLHWFIVHRKRRMYCIICVVDQ
jgi:hypothetical protein